MKAPAAAAATFSAHAREYTARIETQLRWLLATGFAPVDCVYKSWRFAVMAAFKEDGE